MSLLDLVQTTIKERADNYDNPLPNFLRIAILWSVWYSKVFTPLDVVFMMDLMKSAREIHSHSDDTLIDKTGYTIGTYERMNVGLKEIGYSEGVEVFRNWKEELPDHVILSEMWYILIKWKAHEASKKESERES